MGGAALQPPAEVPPLVGRERELALLRAALTAALAGRGALVLIGGEAGIGKTVLAEALATEAAAQGARALIGRCYDLSETPPYGPWAEALARAGPTADGLAPPDFTGGGAGSQVALFAQARDYLAALAGQQPLCLLLDDLHWADPASLDLLRVLARGLTDLPLLLLGTYLSDELTRRHPLYALLPLLVREAHATRLDLHPLDDAGLGALIKRYALPPTDEQRLIAYLRERAEGNPFFVSELLHTLEEEQALRLREAGWVLGALGAAGVPPLLRQVIDARVDRLGEAARALLTVAAVVGQTVPLAVWQVGAATDEATLLAVVEGAEAARLLVETSDGAQVGFAHALIREALYAGVIPARRRGWHRRVGEALLAQPAPDPDAVAYHFQQAGDERAGEWLVRAGERAQRAYAYLTASERFETALALSERRDTDAGKRGWLLLRLARVRRYDAVRQALAATTEAARLGAAAGDQILVVACRLNLGLLRCFVGELREGLTEMAAGVAAHAALCPTDPNSLRARCEALGVAYDEHHHQGTLALWLTLAGRHAEAEELAKCYDYAPAALGNVATDHGSSYADAQAALALIHAALGRPKTARWAFARARDAYRVAGNRNNVLIVLANELAWWALPYAADRLAMRRRLAAAVEAEWAGVRGAFTDSSPDEARLALLAIEGHWARARAVLEARRAVWVTRWQLQAEPEMGAIARAQGDAALAHTLISEWLPDGPDTEFGGALYLGALPLQRLAATLALDAGNLAASYAWLAAHDRWLAWGGAVLGQAEGALGWAEYHWAAGDLALAYEHAARALAHASEPRQPLALLAAHRLLGELATAAGNDDEAQAHLTDALALADACAAPYERALCLLAQAELRAATGDRDGARTVLAEAGGILEPLGAKPALARADTLAARLAATAPTAQTTYPAGLSAREVEVLRLVAQGLSDAQVAKRLYLSPRTVGTHLRAIYNKLGVDNRTAAALFAAAHGLT